MTLPSWLPRWTTRTLVSLLATMIVGIAGVVALMPAGPWTAADVAYLIGTAAAVALVGTLVLFVPFTLLASLVPRPFGVGLPPLLLVAVGFVSYWNKFGFESPTAGDRQLEVFLIWCSLLVGQSIHSLLLVGRHGAPVV